MIIDLSIIKTMAHGSGWLARIPVALMTKKLPKDFSVKPVCDWEAEKEDVLERANWLCKEILIGPEKLMAKVPSVLGRLYGGQWAMYGCSMLLASLANIGYVYPDKKDKTFPYMERLIDLVQTEPLKRFDSEDWKEDPIKGLPGFKGHFTYLTTLGYMIGTYRLAGGNSDRFDELFKAICEGINHRMLQRADMVVVSFTNNYGWVSDMVCACVVLRQYAKLYNDNRYEGTISKWLDLAKRSYVHKRSGIFIGVTNKPHNRTIRGSYAALTNYWLCLLGDDAITKDQYVRTKKIFGKDEPLCGIKEFLREKGTLSFDPNAGPMLYGLSSSGTAIIIGSATYLGDWDFRYRLLSTAEIAGITAKEKGMRHYRLAEIAFVGEAMVLAMRTNVKR